MAVAVAVAPATFAADHARAQARGGVGAVAPGWALGGAPPRSSGDPPDSGSGAVARAESARRLGAELLVLAGDARRLQAGEGGPVERTGLITRIAGGLASLPWLMRQAGARPEPVGALRADAERQDWAGLRVRLASLSARHRFESPVLLDVAGETDALRALGDAIHRASCAACHDAPSTADDALPAKNLSGQLRAMPRAEFAARLWLGVRGDRVTGFANPFSEIELRALMAWYARE